MLKLQHLEIRRMLAAVQKQKQKKLPFGTKPYQKKSVAEHSVAFNGIEYWLLKGLGIRQKSPQRTGQAHLRGKNSPRGASGVVRMKRNTIPAKIITLLDFFFRIANGAFPSFIQVAERFGLQNMGHLPHDTHNPTHNTPQTVQTQLSAE